MARKQVKSVAGKVVAITGGARGIGRCTAQALIRRGARVAIGDLHLDLAEQTAAELGGNCVAFELDVTDRESFSRFLDDAAERARADRRPHQQRRDHAGRPVRRGDRRDREDDDRHQPPRRHLRDQARARADAPPRQRPHRQHRQPGRQGRAPRRRHLLRDQARGRRAQRGRPAREHRHGHRGLVRDAGRRQHRARQRPDRHPRRQEARARGGRRGDRRGDRDEPLRRLGAEVIGRHLGDPQPRPAQRPRGDRPAS